MKHLALALAAAVIVVGLIVDVREVAMTFLVAYAACVSVVLGVMTIILIAHLTTATWFRPFRLRAQRVLQSLPLLAVIGVAMLPAVPVLYPWAAAQSPAHRYLNAPFFVVRWIFYWTIWLSIASSLRTAWRLEQSGDFARAARRFRVTACVGLILLGVTMTFAAFDWLMSLTPGWSSTIYGVYWIAGSLGGAAALLAVLAGDARDGWPSVSTSDLQSLAKLLLTFVLFWLYIGFAQYIVIWSADLPSEVPWYVLRLRGGWAALATALLFGHFVLPFALLMLRAARRNRGVVAGIGVALLGFHYLDIAWIAMPGTVSVRWWTAIVAAAAAVLVLAAARVNFLHVAPDPDNRLGAAYGGRAPSPEALGG